MSDLAEIVEVVEEDIELEPTHTGLVEDISQSKKGTEDILWLAENIEAIVAAKNKIITTMLKLAKPGDWVSFSSESDPDGTASLKWTGASRIGGALGIDYVDRKMRKIIGRDKEGEWYRFECEVTCIRGNHQVRTWGRAGTRDVFFGKADGKWRDVSECNEGNIKAAAIHGAQKEGVKTLLGIPNFPVKDLIEMGVNIDFTKGHKFKGKVTATGAGEQQTEEEQPVRNKIRTMLLEINGDDMRKAADMLEALSGFEGNEGPVKGKRNVDYLKGKWLFSTYAKVKTAYKEKLGRDYAPPLELPVS